MRWCGGLEWPVADDAVQKAVDFWLFEGKSLTFAYLKHGKVRNSPPTHSPRKFSPRFWPSAAPPPPGAEAEGASHGRGRQGL